MAYRKALEVVNQVNADYPGLIASNSTYFRDQVCHRLRKEDPNWGTKARNSDGSNRNADALAYMTTPPDRSRKILVDIIIASETPDAKPAWQEYPGDNLGNGYWTEPQLPDLDGVTPPPPPPPPSGEPHATAAQVAALATQIAAFLKQADDMNELRYRDVVAHFEELKALVLAKPEHFAGSVRVFGVSAPLTLDPR